MALRGLDEAGIPSVEAFVGGSVNAIAAAVSVGLAGAVLARAVAPAGSVEVGARYGLPSLRGTDLVLHSGRAIDERANGALCMIVAPDSDDIPIARFCGISHRHTNAVSAERVSDPGRETLVQRVLGRLGQRSSGRPAPHINSSMTSCSWYFARGQ
ncbi:hypothetical protein [Burkholderia metallica]|uniref:hypothetical protein n=1 Tax=Burkholderia metallica TaxID=488729 RepID=UPI00157B5FAD|nr:hypothetical protein [Burkholderia metallica]